MTLWLNKTLILVLLCIFFMMMRTNAMNKVLYSDMEYSNEDMVKFLYDCENMVLMLGVFDVIIRM